SSAPPALLRIRRQLVALVRKFQGKLQRLLIHHIDRDPAIPADIRRDFDVRVLNQRALLRRSALERHAAGILAGDREHLASNLPGNLLPWILFDRAWLRQAMIPQPLMNVHSLLATQISSDGHL